MLADHASGVVFRLPGGLVLAENRRIDRVEMRPLTGKEEDWLAAHSTAPSAQIVSRLLRACVTRMGDAEPNAELVGKLLVGDRDYLMLQLRRLTLGDKFEAVLECPACAGKLDVAFQADDVGIEARPQKEAWYSCRPSDSIKAATDSIGAVSVRERSASSPVTDGPRSVETSLDAADTSVCATKATGAAARVISFRLPTGEDQEAVLGMPAGQAVEKLLARCVVDDGGRPLSPEEQLAVIEAMEAAAPQVDLQLDLACPECGHKFTVPFDINNFFFDEMKINGKQMLREVHLLAFYYHWSERDILSLSRERRRAYLELLSDELRQD